MSKGLGGIMQGVSSWWHLLLWVCATEWWMTPSNCRNDFKSEDGFQQKHVLGSKMHVANKARREGKKQWELVFDVVAIHWVKHILQSQAEAWHHEYASVVAERAGRNALMQGCSKSWAVCGQGQMEGGACLKLGWEQFVVQSVVRGGAMSKWWGREGADTMVYGCSLWL